MAHSEKVALAALLKKEEELRFRQFNEEDALRLGLLFTEKAAEAGLAIAIDISTKDRVLFHCSCKGAQPDNDQWIIRKKRLVNRFGHSSFYMGQLLRHEGKTLQEKYLVSPEEFAPFGGSFPIHVTGVGIIGTITVSGLPQEDDHALVVETLARFLEA